VKSDGKIDIALLVEKLEELWRWRFNLDKKVDNPAQETV
jgi:hypothetical protein